MQQSSLPGFEPPPFQMHNLFFALQPDDATRARIDAAAQSLRHDHPVPGRWIKPPRYHLTLKFLGEHTALPPDLIVKAIAAAGRVRVDAFELQLDTVGSFTNAKVSWFGCMQTPAGLSALFDQLDHALRANGCRIFGGKHLVPHVTVLRDSEHALDLPLDPAIRWQVDEFVLIDSQIHPARPYRIVQRWPLR